jgi:hypothetical protein
MKRLTIIIPQQKRYILSILYEKFPHFKVDLLDSEKPITFIAMLEEGKDYVSDLAWLKRIGLEYFDEIQERQKVISDFFRGVVIEGMMVRNVSFPGHVDDSSYFRVVLTLHDAVDMMLLFPRDWMPPKL